MATPTKDAAAWWVSITASRPTVRPASDVPRGEAPIDVETVCVEGIAPGGRLTVRLFGEVLQVQRAKAGR